MTDFLSPQQLDPSRSENSDMFVHAFARGLGVIRSFGEGAERQTLSDVARRSNISRASARRLLHTLLQLGYVDYDGKLFWLKPQVLDLGYSFIASLDFAGIAQDALNDLATKSGTSASMCVLAGNEIVYVARSTIRNGSRCTNAIGDRHTAHLLAMGRILLAQLSDDELNQYVTTVPLTRHTPFTITDPKELKRIIRADGEKGWSIVRREMSEGVCAVAMPIRSKDDRVVAGLGLSIRPDLSNDPDVVDATREMLGTAIESIEELISLRV